ncbi:unnamed protein product, partial [Prorocentrum cordatum]
EVRPAKVCMYDDAVTWDPGQTWTTEIRGPVRAIAASEPIFNDKHAQRLKHLKGAAVKIRLPKLAPYQMRRSGASRDRLRPKRAPGEIQKRGK